MLILDSDMGVFVCLDLTLKSGEKLPENICSQNKNLLWLLTT